MELKNIPVLVTGGASGLGAATAKAVAAAGAKVRVLALNIELAEKVAAAIGGIAFQCDVSDEASAKAAIEKARTQHGVARVLVNCAGIGGASRIVGKEGPIPLENFEKII